MLRKTTNVFSYVIVALVGVLMAFNYIIFVTPNDFAPAGINGIAVMVQKAAGFSIGYMSLLINVPLCIFAFFMIEKKFSIKTLVYTLIYSGVFLLFQELENSKIINLDYIKYITDGHDTIYPVIIAGLIAGAAYGILFRNNGCTGGTDIVAKYVSKVKPRWNFFWVTFLLNAVVAVASCFVFENEVTGGINYKPACLSLLYSFVSSFVGNVLLKGSKQAYKFVIISPHVEELERDIIENLHHSATRLEGAGVYTGTHKVVLLCIINKHQLVDFEKIIKKYPETFAFVESVNETLGNFKQIKPTK